MDTKTRRKTFSLGGNLGENEAKWTFFVLRSFWILVYISEKYLKANDVLTNLLQNVNRQSKILFTLLVGSPYFSMGKVLLCQMRKSPKLLLKRDVCLLSTL